MVYQQITVSTLVAKVTLLNAWVLEESAAPQIIIRTQARMEMQLRIPTKTLGLAARRRQPALATGVRRATHSSQTLPTSELQVVLQPAVTACAAILTTPSAWASEALCVPRIIIWMQPRLEIQPQLLTRTLTVVLPKPPAMATRAQQATIGSRIQPISKHQALVQPSVVPCAAILTTQNARVSETSIVAQISIRIQTRTGIRSRLPPRTMRMVAVAAGCQYAPGTIAQHITR